MDQRESLRLFCVFIKAQLSLKIFTWFIQFFIYIVQIFTGGNILMKKVKRILSSLLICMMMLSVVPADVYAATTDIIASGQKQIKSVPDKINLFFETLEAEAKTLNKFYLCSDGSVNSSYTFNVNVTEGSNAVDESLISWKAGDSNIISIAETSGKSNIIKALKEGKTTITAEYKSKTVTADVVVTSVESAKSRIKELSVSFPEKSWSPTTPYAKEMDECYNLMMCAFTQDELTSFASEEGNEK